MTEEGRKEQLEKEGVKYDGGKLRYDLLPADSLKELVKVYTMGAEKYTDHNWRKGLKWSRVFGALMRHAWSWFMGEDLDPESGLNHMTHAAWNCFTLVSFAATHPELDDRIKNDDKEAYKKLVVNVFDEEGSYCGEVNIDPDNLYNDLTLKVA